MQVPYINCLTCPAAHCTLHLVIPKNNPEQKENKEYEDAEKQKEKIENTDKHRKKQIHYSYSHKHARLISFHFRFFLIHFFKISAQAWRKLRFFLFLIQAFHFLFCPPAQASHKLRARFDLFVFYFIFQK